ncbi:DUF695 domain-containing protein [Paenibacillus humicola]|uniref:DUF695 domain-containing protein n=1 Tax=Paenibacillus humicola TaxID=3110540 RepID=UPI00237AD758|nr:DUF695 domain-containing protein [Paenibacillus humicola]
MTDNWGFYERRSDTEELRVLINVGYKASAPLPGRSALLSVTVNLYPVRERNRSKRDFIRQLERLETQLEQRLKTTADGIYIGRINAATRLEFYYYVRAEMLDKANFEQWIKTAWPFRAEHYVKPDPEWDLYRYLLPDALEELFMHNAQMIYALLHKGDDIKRPRHVYHWLLFRQDEDRRQAESALRGLGYRIEREKEGSPDDSFPYPLVISKFEDVRLDTVNERVRELYRLISGSGGRYDGWGSVLKLTGLGRLRQQMRKMMDATQAYIRRSSSTRR